MIHIPTTLQQKIRGGQDVNPVLKLAAEDAYRPRSLNAPRSTSEPGESLLDTIAGGSLSVEPLAWADALAAIEKTDPEGLALLQRRGDGATTVELALEQGLSTAALAKRLQAARQRLRGLSEVQAVMAAG